LRPGHGIGSSRHATTSSRHTRSCRFPTSPARRRPPSRTARRRRESPRLSTTSFRITISVEQRHSVVLQYIRDLRLSPIERLLHPRAQRFVAFLHTHRDIEGERQV